MVFKQSHAMRLETTHPSGAEEWLCLECGRRFVAQWEPRFRRVVLVPGRDEIVHMGQAISNLNETANITAENNADLQDVWKDLLDKLDFGTEGDDLDKSP